jgi:20S proteasome alpha/beta subunit
MTLVVGLVGEDHIVMAADTDTRLGDSGGFYGTKCHKLLSVNGEAWILGVAGIGAATVQVYCGSS